VIGAHFEVLYPPASKAEGAYGWRCRGCNAGPWVTVAELEEHERIVSLGWGKGSAVVERLPLRAPPEPEAPLPPTTSGHLGVVPLSPRREEEMGGGESVAAGLIVMAFAVLAALGVVHLIEIFHRYGGR